jgi:hypothetical protein
MDTDHLQGREPWFWVYADRTLHLQVQACADGYVTGENEANARLIASAPELLAALQRQIANIEAWLETGIAADPEESRSIYEQMKIAAYKAVCLMPPQHQGPATRPLA